MITLQQLLMTDSDLSGGTQTGKGTDGAQDFLPAGWRPDGYRRSR
jgi:flagellar hook-length control protein FliK